MKGDVQQLNQSDSGWRGRRDWVSLAWAGRNLYIFWKKSNLTEF